MGPGPFHFTQMPTLSIVVRQVSIARNANFPALFSLRSPPFPFLPTTHAAFVHLSS